MVLIRLFYIKLMFHIICFYKMLMKFIDETAFIISNGKIPLEPISIKKSIIFASN